MTPLTWVHVSPLRELPYCALVDATPGGRIHFACGESMRYDQVFVATTRAPGLECRACVRALGLGS